jgi:transposase
MDKRFLEECLARGMSLHAIGEQVGKHYSTVGYWLKNTGSPQSAGIGSRRVGDSTAANWKLLSRMA